MPISINNISLKCLGSQESLEGGITKWSLWKEAMGVPVGKLI